jgi:hypothetical protein
VESVRLKKFLKLKQNGFWDACGKLLHPIIYHKVACELAERFKEGRSIKNYQSLRDVVARNLKTTGG